MGAVHSYLMIPPDTYRGLASGGSGVKSCYEKMTFAYHWSGADEPPSAVVLKVSATAIATGSPSDRGSADNSLGDAPINQGANGRRSDGVDYVLKTVAPDGTFTYDDAAPSASAVGSAFVSVKVEVTPIVVAVSGTTQVGGGLKTLIGRQQIGSVGAAGYDLKAHNWSVSGPQLFDHVDTTVGVNGRAYAPFVGSHTDPTVSFYASKDGTETVSCSCNVYLAGTTTLVGSATAVRLVTVKRPTYTISVYAVAGTYTGYTGTNTNPGQVTSGRSTQLPAGGMEFDYTVVNPQEFSTDSGTAALCQLIDENSTIDPGYHFVTNGYWLDKEFPYEGDSFSVDPYGTGPTVFSDYDTPYQGLDATDTAFNLNNQFATTSIYKPYGGEYVPLGTRKWSWITTGYKSNGVWSNPTGGLAINATQTDFDLTKATWYKVYTP